MLQFLNSINFTLFGDPKRFALEHRLFNTISLLNAVANIGGALAVLSLKNAAFLFVLNLGTGILFLLFYYLSRFRHTFQYLYWPFVLSILGFLFINALENAGSRGGAHYYFIPALVIAIVLSGRTSRTTIAIALFCSASVALLVLEQLQPGWITSYADQRERFIDIAGNLLFVQVFMGILVQVLSQNLNLERSRSERLLRSVLPETIAEELKQTDRVQPVDYEQATVLFTDFVGSHRLPKALLRKN